MRREPPEEGVGSRGLVEVLVNRKGLLVDAVIALVLLVIVDAAHGVVEDAEALSVEAGFHSILLVLLVQVGREPRHAGAVIGRAVPVLRLDDELAVGRVIVDLGVHAVELLVLVGIVCDGLKVAPGGPRDRPGAKGLLAGVVKALRSGQVGGRLDESAGLAVISIAVCIVRSLAGAAELLIVASDAEPQVLREAVEDLDALGADVFVTSAVAQIALMPELVGGQTDSRV